MYQEQNALQNARARAQEIEEMGHNALTSLVEQRKMLEAAAEKMLRIADTIGISDQLMKVIKRRDTVDKLIIWGGMGAIVLLMLVLWFFVRR
jgi:golgi SNAP receptor complex member 2